MSLETEIMSYLYTYGNTKESDLARYGTRNIGESAKTMRGILDRMVAEGKISRLTHNKLGSNVVYFTLGKHLLNEILVHLETEILGTPKMGEKDKRIIQSIRRILKEAERVPNRRVKKRAIGERSR